MDIQIVQRDSRRWAGALIFNQWVKPTDNEGGFNSIDISVVLLQFEKNRDFFDRRSYTCASTKIIDNNPMRSPNKKRAMIL